MLNRSCHENIRCKGVIPHQVRDGLHREATKYKSPQPNNTNSNYQLQVPQRLMHLQFTIFNAVERVNEMGDIFKGVIGKGINLKQVLKKIESVFGEQEMHESLRNL